MASDLLPLSSVLGRAVSALGLSMERVLERAEIPASIFAQDKPRVATKQFFALWRAIESVSGDPAFGFRIAGAAQAMPRDVASTAALCAPTFGEALRTYGRYKKLVCPEEVTLETSPGEVRVRFAWVLAEEPTPPLLVDAMFTAAVLLGRRGTGKPITPRRIELARSALHEPVLAEHFQCPIVFDANEDVLVFDTAVLDEPMLTHNDDLLAVMLPGLEAALDGGGASSLADQVRRVIGKKMGGQRPSIQVVARAMSMSGRTLQRRLQEAGTSFQDVLDDVRKETARQLLQTTDLDVGEIAFFLGFEEVNSFTRAFHLWEGTTPARWRAARG